MKRDLYIIEARDDSGQLKFDCPDPYLFFGFGAIQGLNTDAMAKAIFRQVPGATLAGDNIPNWPKLINPNWVARLKTW